MQNAKEIKYIKMEDVFALKDFSLLEMPVMFVHLMPLMIYQDSDVFALKDISLSMENVPKLTILLLSLFHHRHLHVD
jgi:hypothetical protein